MARPGPEGTYAIRIASYPLVPPVRPAVVMYEQELHVVVVGSGTVAASLVVVSGEAVVEVVVKVVVVVVIVIRLRGWVPTTGVVVPRGRSR